MSDKRRAWTGRGLFARLISPLAFLAIATVLAGVYCLLHLLGWREQVGFLSGNFPSGTGARWPLLQGVVYLFSYFAFVLAVPILVLAAGIFSALLRLPPGGKLKGRGQTGSPASSILPRLRRIT